MIVLFPSDTELLPAVPDEVCLHAGEHEPDEDRWQLFLGGWMAKVHLEVEGTFDYSSKLQKATMTIDRSSGMVRLRVHRRRKVYEVPLAAVAQLVFHKAVQQEVEENRRRPRSKLVSRGLLTRGR